MGVLWPLTGLYKKISSPALASPVCVLRPYETEGRKDGNMGRIRDGEVEGREFLYLTPTRYTVTTRMTALRWAAV